MRYRGILKEHASLWDVVLRVADAGLVALTGWLSAVIYIGELPQHSVYGIGLVLAILLVEIVFPSFGLYRAWRGGSLLAEIRGMALAWIAVLSALAVIAFLTKRGPEFSRGWFLTWLLIGWAGFALERIVLRGILGFLRRRGFNQRRVVVVRNGGFGVDVVRGIEAAPWAGLKVIAMFCAGGHDCTCQEPGARFADQQNDFEGMDGLAAFVARENIDQVWIALPLKEEDCIHRVLHELRHSTVDVRYVPDVSGLRLLNQSVTEVAGFPVMNLACSQMDGLNGVLKAIEDRLLALLILVLIAPLMVLIALGVKLTSPGPVFFRQTRLGLRGERITVLKFRSMMLHEEPPGRLTQARINDPRVTRFGAFLRRTSLDELPQFFNVLTGTMSIVGPRPHALVHNEQYKEPIEKYMLRHKVKPGITGWAQINGYRGETDTLEKMRKRIEYDLHYIENWSFWLDLKIIALTVLKGFLQRNAH